MNNGMWTLLIVVLGLAGCVAQGMPQNVPDVRLPSGNKADGLDGSTDIDPTECPDGEPRLVDGHPATWTVIHYAAADNNLEPQILGDINEMEKGHGGSRSVNVLVQLDKRSEDGVWRYEIQRDGERERIASRLVGHSDEEPDSGDWRTLAAFGRWAITCYPAENYFVIVAGHGYGYKRVERGSTAELENRAQHIQARARGEALRIIAPDDSAHTEIYLNELVQALEVIERSARREGDPEWLKRLVAYGSDACLMQTLEVGYELRNTVTYLLGSEETEPGSGWPYSTVLRTLTDRPSYYARRPHMLAEHVVRNYGRSYTPWGAASSESDNHTLAALDTASMIRVRNRVSTVGELLVGMLEDDAGLAADIWAARHEAFTFGDGYTDLAKLLDGIRARMIASGRMPEVRQHWDGDERARDLRNTIDDLREEVWPELVVASGVGDAYPGAGGVSIYFPTDQCGFSLDVGRYLESAFAGDTQWGQLVQKMLTDFPEGGGVVAAYGRGTMDVSVDGNTMVGLESECELDEGRLFVFNYGGASVSDGAGGSVIAPQVNMNLEVSGLDIRTKTAFVLSEEPMFTAEVADLDVEIEGVTVEPGSRYTGTLRIPFVRRDTGETIRMNVTFDCNDLEARACN